MPWKPKQFRPPSFRTREAKSRESDKQRGNSTKRGYNYRWQKARKAFLAENPLCVECEKENRYTPATDVDHITPHRGDAVLFWDRSNWQSLCGTCHGEKTRREGSGKTTYARQHVQPGDERDE